MKTVKFLMLISLCLLIVPSYSMANTTATKKPKADKCTNTSMIQGKATNRPGKKHNKHKECKPVKNSCLPHGNLAAKNSAAGKKCEKKCQQALKYLAKSKSDKNPRTKQTYYQKYLKYADECPVDNNNQKPVALNAQHAMPQLSQSLIVLVGDDVEDGRLGLKFEIVTMPTRGQLIDHSNGNVTYISSTLTGSDSFAYKVIDSAGAESNIAIITIHVNNGTAFKN